MAIFPLRPSLTQKVLLSRKRTFSSGAYRTLIRGQTLTLKDSPCWWSSGSPPGAGNPCDSSIVERQESRLAPRSVQGRWEILTR